MKNRFLKWWSARLPLRIISDGERPYLERYFVAQVFGMNVYLHRFVASDPDRGLHDHPWRWAFSVVLSGWYYEHTRYGVARVRWFNRLSGESFHRVVLPEGAEAWTLFVHRSTRAKPWGFLRDKGQIGLVYREHVPQPGEHNRWWKTATPGAFNPRRMP